jgi:hypothetical protein
MPVRTSDIRTRYVGLHHDLLKHAPILKRNTVVLDFCRTTRSTITQKTH